MAPAVPTTKERTRLDWLLLAALSALPLVLCVASTRPGSYGYFIDEFYYIACAKRLAFGYVDHPPLAPLILAATMPVLGVSRLGIRLTAFLAAAATVWVTGLQVWQLGGRRFATTLAALSAGAEGAGRLWVRPNLLLSAVRPDARRSGRREGRGQPSRRGLRQTAKLSLVPVVNARIPLAGRGARSFSETSADTVATVGAPFACRQPATSSHEPSAVSPSPSALSAEP
jgi:hypothetical protein